MLVLHAFYISLYERGYSDWIKYGVKKLREIMDEKNS